MQDSLKPKTPALSKVVADNHNNRMVTPQNIDELILKLNQMDTTQFHIKSDRHSKIEKQYSSSEALFSDRFIQTPGNTGLQAKDYVEPLYRHRHSVQHTSLSRTEGKRCRRLTPINKDKLTPIQSKGTNMLYSLPLVAIPSPSKLKFTPLSIIPIVSSCTTTHSIKPSSTTAAVITDDHHSSPSTVSYSTVVCEPKLPPAASGCGHSTISKGSGDEIEIIDDERDSGWTDSDYQWLVEEEEEMSDIDDEGSIMTSELESDDVWYHSGSIHDDVSIGCGPSMNLNVSFIPSRTVAIGERVGGTQATPPLTPSLFPGRSPTIHFPLANEKYVSLRPEQKSLLLWKMNSITPNVVKHVIARVGFKPTNGNKWMGYWGKHMKSEAFRAISQHQKVNHFPGSFNLGRKDRLWRNLSRMQIQHGKREFDFTPETYVLPNDIRNFRRMWESTNSGSNKSSKWIIKPPASARGIGVKVISKWSQIPKKRAVIVQRYISNPFLINGSKFDLRVYVYVSSFDPLVIYIYRDGLVRFATVKYSKSTKKLSNRYMHLTNYSVNKHSSMFISNSDETQCYGHKWGLLALWKYLDDTMSIDPMPVWEQIKDVVVKTIISCEGSIGSLIKANVRHSSSVHELFGFDIMLDKHLKPWLLEVNVSPSLHSNSSLDRNIKEVMMRDIFNISRFKLPSLNESLCGVRAVLSTEDKIKHSKFTHSGRFAHQIEPVKILDQLSEDDCNVLMDLEDEYNVRGGLIRVFPQQNSYSVYAKYFNIQRYYNILVDQWLSKHNRSPDQGIIELRKYAEKYHSQKT